MVFKNIKQALLSPDQVTTLMIKGKTPFDMAKADLGKFQNLRELYIQSSNSSCLQVEPIAKLDTLSIMSDYVEIDSSVFNHPNLRKLEIKNSNLFSLPKIPKDHCCLEILNLFGNSISSFDESFLLLKALKELNLSSNIFKIFPNVLLQLKRIERISINGNRLQTIPMELKNLNLNYLSVEANNFSESEKAKILDNFGQIF